MQQAYALTAEGRAAIAAAEGMAQANDPGVSPGSEVNVTDSGTSRSGPAAGHGRRVCRNPAAYAAFKDALYQLAEAQMKSEKWQDALNTLGALQKIGTDYRDVKDSFRQRPPTPSAISLCVPCESVLPSVEIRISRYSSMGRACEAALSRLFCPGPGSDRVSSDFRNPKVPPSLRAQKQ